MRILTVPSNGTAALNSTNSAVILPANNRRSFATISNSTANGLWLGFGAAAVKGSGLYVAPNGGVFIMDEPGAIFRGAINGIFDTGTGNVGTLELQ